ncbi:MAG: hypothetical protein M3O22_00710 [Pseudomonadota bacterium]|nr:hypothetical protein [Pseudomonadota bacterium]
MFGRILKILGIVVVALVALFVVLMVVFWPDDTAPLTPGQEAALVEVKDWCMKESARGLENVRSMGLSVDPRLTPEVEQAMCDCQSRLIVQKYGDVPAAEMTQKYMQDEQAKQEAMRCMTLLKP